MCPTTPPQITSRGAVLDGFAIEHGWIEKDGMVIDPTLPTDEIVYFPGLRFRGQYGLAKMRLRKE